MLLPRQPVKLEDDDSSEGSDVSVDHVIDGLDELKISEGSRSDQPNTRSRHDPKDMEVFKSVHIQTASVSTNAPADDPDEMKHTIYADEILDYFMLSSSDNGQSPPTPPPNFQPDWIIDNEGHTTLHWACAMGDLEVIRMLKEHGANIACQNARGETPLMRSVMFTNCYENDRMPGVAQELISTVGALDSDKNTVLHHAVQRALVSESSGFGQERGAFYLETILRAMQGQYKETYIQLLVHTRNSEGNTALDLALEHQESDMIVNLLVRYGANKQSPPPAQPVEAGEKIKVDWPAPVRHYVQRSFEPGRVDPDVPRAEMEAKLKETISNATDRNVIHTLDWDNLLLPQEMIRQEWAQVP